MAVSKASAYWEGELKKGRGGMALGSGQLEADFNFGTRFEQKPGTNPEELIGAALAGCFSMAFSAMLGEEGVTPDRIETNAKVHLEEVKDGFAITRIELSTAATIPGMEKTQFLEIAEKAKNGCPVSKALSGVEITLDARLTHT